MLTKPNAITVLSVETFIKSYRSNRNEIYSGKKVAVKIDDERFYAFPLRELDENITKLPALEIATKDTSFGKNSHSININPNRLIKAIKNAGRYESVGICEMGEGCIYFLNQEQKERLLQRQERRQMRDAKKGGVNELDAMQEDHEEISMEIEPINNDLTEQQGVTEESNSSDVETNDKSDWQITRKRSHWDNLRSEHRDEDFVESVTLHRGRIVGLLVRADKAETLSCGDAPVLSDREVEWSVKFKKNHAGLNCLKETAGLVSYGNDILFYASLGYVMAHKDRFEPLIETGLWVEMEKEHKETRATLLAEYWRHRNPINLELFSQRRGSVFNAINGTADKHHSESDFTVGVPVALLHTTKLKAIVVAGDVSNKGLNVLRADSGEFSLMWKGLRDKFEPDTMLVVTIKKQTATFLSPDLSNDIVYDTLQNLSPSRDEMIDFAKDHAGKFGHRHPDSRSGKADAFADAPATEAGEIVSPVPFTDQPSADLQDTTVSSDQPQSDQESIPAEPAFVDVKDPEMKALSVLQQIALVARALQSVRAAERHIVEHMIGEDRLIVFGGDLAAKFNETTLPEFVEVYNTLKADDEPVLKYEVIEYTGGVSDKARILSEAFCATQGGQNLVILRADKETVVVGNNAAFTNFVRDFQ